MVSPAVHILGVIALLVAVYLATDPFKYSPIAGVKNFKVQGVPVPSSEILAAIPRDNENRLRSSELKYGGQVFGPESVVFDSQGRGPYTGVGDGRVMRWDGDEKGWVEFAVLISNRTEVCDQPQPLTANIKHEAICGRPLGLRFNKQTGDMFIADAYLGLLKVGPEGGVAELLTNKADDGQKLLFTNDLDISDDGTVYFTDSSTKYLRKYVFFFSFTLTSGPSIPLEKKFMITGRDQRLDVLEMNFIFPILEAESGGRLLKWDPKTKETTVLVRNLMFPNGVAFNKDYSFLALAEAGVGRMSRYWVKGPQAGTLEKNWIWLAGYPDNVRANGKGEFWVALHCRRTFVDMFFKPRPMLKQAFLKLPMSVRVLYSLLNGKPSGAIYKYNEQGEFVDVLEDQTGEVVKLISEIEEHDGKLYIGSVLLPHVAVYTLPK